MNRDTIPLSYHVPVPDSTVFYAAFSAAAELILLEESPVRFLRAEDDREDKEDPEFDFFLFTKLEDARDLMLQILQDRRSPFRVRAAIVLALAHDLQQRIDRNALFEADSLLDRYSSPKVRDWFTDRLGSLDVSKDERDRTAGSLFVILHSCNGGDHLSPL